MAISTLGNNKVTLGTTTYINYFRQSAITSSILYHSVQSPPSFPFLTTLVLPLQ